VLAFVLTLTLIVSETQRNVVHSYLDTFLERGATLPGIGFGNTDSNDTVCHLWPRHRRELEEIFCSLRRRGRCA
jgi:hypothetical protein